MRHRVAGRKLSRTKEHRLAMRRNMVSSLFEHETISTTIEKAKEVKPFAEKLITLAKKGDLSARRRAISLLGNRKIVALEDGVEVKKGTVIGKLFSDLGPRYLDRPGGYTRIIRLALKRLGDNGQLVLLQLVSNEESTEEQKQAPKKKRSKKVAEKVEAKQDSVPEQAQDISESSADTEGSLEEQAEETNQEEKQD
ncbi:MAG: 50S ribosomal protein L17 [Sedimentisphaerales bacterium]|nr:50S ribosomal protein L17 [Sedimentisphaerales bacterium]